jgi:hypothetical protein
VGEKRTIFLPPIYCPAKRWMAEKWCYFSAIDLFAWFAGHV